jgi:hypothetical protein
MPENALRIALSRAAGVQPGRMAVSIQKFFTSRAVLNKPSSVDGLRRYAFACD